MKRFNFRLQRVLDIKNTIEEVKRRDFLAAYNEFQKAAAKLREYLNILENYQIKLFRLLRKEKGVSSSAGTYVDLPLLNFYYRFFQSLNSQISFQQSMIEIARGEMEKRRKVLLEAVKERRILEQLRQRKYDQHLFEAGKEEQFHLDEISGGKFFQRKLKTNPSK